MIPVRRNITRSILLFFVVLASALMVLSDTKFKNKGQVVANEKQIVPVVTLQTSESPLDTDGPISALFTSPSEDETVYIVNGQTGEVGAYKSDKASFHPFAYTSGPLAIQSREYFAYIDKNSHVILAQPRGQVLGHIKTPSAISVAFLGNGNIVVASPTKSDFLHLYEATGQFLKSFGAVKKHKPGDHGQNAFLHKGKVLVDVNDNIYYVYHYIPLIQKFTSSGKLEGEIEVKGNAIDIQQEVAQRFLRNRKPDVTGGITVITSAAIDYVTGHLWIGLNGSSNTGVVYEYDTNGEKISEYALQAHTLSAEPQIIIGVRDIAITASKLYVLTDQYQVFSFSKPGNSGRSAIGSQTRTSVNQSYSIRSVSWTAPVRKPTPAMQGSCPEPQT